MVFLYNGILFSYKEHEILSFAEKWMELKNIILSKVRFRKPKNTCFLSCVEYRPNTNTRNIMENRSC
jgi:hypothetical protein